jgi:hypothetical protein
MYTAALIRRHINRLEGDKPFSIREFLNYGSRNAVDQVFFRLVKSGQIIRVARGLFIKDTFPKPTILDVALAKAAAFGKRLAVPGAQAAQELRLSTDINPTPEAVYVCNGCSSSFRFGNIRIRFISTCQRKISLGDELAGLAIRALWYLGKYNCSHQRVSDAMALFNRNDRQALREKIKIMPAWLTSYFISCDRGSGQRLKKKYGFESFFYRY